MSILQDFTNRIKAVSRADWMVVIVLILMASLSFMLGRLSVLYGGGGELKIEYPAAAQGAAAVLGISENREPDTQNPLPSSGGGGYVASKNGSKYFLPWCGSVNSIKEENRVYFDSKAEAEAAGYTPAANCKGL